MLPPVGQDADDAQHRHADHLSGSAYAQGEAIEVDVDHVEVGERILLAFPYLLLAIPAADELVGRPDRSGKVIHFPAPGTRKR